MPARKPFREAKLRIDPDAEHSKVANDLISLLAEAMEAQRLVLASPELSLNQLGKRERRCRTHLAKLLRISWLGPRIIEAIVDSTQPGGLIRRALLKCDLSIAWAEQELQFGLAA